MKKVKKNKKAQVKMMETIMVLLVFAFLFGLIMIFYARFQVLELNRIASQVEEQRAASFLNKILNMPELRCSLSFGPASEINCLDTYKLLAFTQLKENFKDEFVGLSNVTIVREYPPIVGKEEKCDATNLNNLANYPKNCGYWNLFDTGKKSRVSFDTFVTLCTPKQAGFFECEIGRLIVGVPKR